MGQWIYYGDPIGNFGTAYDYRTMVALMGLGANTTDIAIYPRTSTDSAGADLTGQRPTRSTSTPSRPQWATASGR